MTKEREVNLREEVADVLRCTAHIPEWDIRAKYVVKDLQLRGYEIVHVADVDQCPVCLGKGVAPPFPEEGQMQEGCDNCGGVGRLREPLLAHLSKP